jgi:hypothetical protein
MPQEAEKATVRLFHIEWQPPMDLYKDEEVGRMGEDRPHLMMVSFRVTCGRDAFPIRVLMDRRQANEDSLIRDARKRAEAMLRAALRAMSDD